MVAVTIYEINTLVVIFQANLIVTLKGPGNPCLQSCNICVLVQTYQFTKPLLFSSIFWKLHFFLDIIFRTTLKQTFIFIVEVFNPVIYPIFVSTLIFIQISVEFNISLFHIYISD